MFSDLCLKLPVLQQAKPEAHVARQRLTDLYKVCSQLGYRRVAVERRVKGGRAAAVTSDDVESLLLVKEVAVAQGNDFEALTRLCFANVGEISECQAITMNNKHVRSFDIIAIEPTSEKTFRHACSNADVDIISLNLSGRLPFYLKHNPVGVAITRGITFEVCYCHAIGDSTARQNFISNLQALIRVSKGRNIIVSSGTGETLGLRGSNDMVNLLSMIGMTREQAKAAVTSNTDIAVSKAVARRSVQGVLVITENK